MNGMDFMASEYENKKVLVEVIERKTSSAIQIYSIKGMILRAEDEYIKINKELINKSDIMKIEIIKNRK